MIYIIFFIAFILRIWNINQSLWLDEAAQAIESVNNPFFIWKNMGGDFHPPLFHIIFHYWLYIGNLEWVMRLLPLIFGLGSIILTFILSERLFNKKVALLSAFLLAINPFHIYFSQELRPYMMGSFLILLQILLLWLSIKRGRWWWIFFSFVNALCFYTSYFTIFIIISEAAALFAVKAFRKKTIPFSLSSVCAFIAFLPWLPNVAFQLEISSGIARNLPGWSDSVSTPVLKVLPLIFVKFIIGQINFSPPALYGAIAVFCSLVWGYLFVKSLSLRDSRYIFMMILTAVSLILPVVFSVFLQITAPKRVLYLLPLFVILIALGLSKLKAGYFYIFLIILTFISSTALMIYQFDPKFQREDWRSAVGLIDQLSDSNSAVIFKFSGPFAPYLFYSRQTGQNISLAENLQVSETSFVKLQQEITNKQKLFVFGYLGALTDPSKITEKQIEKLGFQKSDTFDFPGVGLIDYYQK